MIGRKRGSRRDRCRWAVGNRHSISLFTLHLLSTAMESAKHFARLEIDQHETDRNADRQDPPEALAVVALGIFGLTAVVFVALFLGRFGLASLLSRRR